MEIEIPKNYNVRRLRRWLNYELSSSVLFLLSWFWNITIILMFIAAFVFIPFMLKVLIEEKRFGWIIFFLVIVVMPIIIFFAVNMDSSYKYFLSLIILAFFYFYCFVLKLTIRDW